MNAKTPLHEAADMIERLIELAEPIADAYCDSPACHVCGATARTLASAKILLARLNKDRPTRQVRRDLPADKVPTR